MRFAQLICTGGVLAQWGDKERLFCALGTEGPERPLSSIHILIADDYADWRGQVRLLLQVRPEWHAIAEAADGSEAIQKAEELKPDLILLDIGLPKLNGVEVARRIRQLSPSSKIIFLSQNNDRDIVQAAQRDRGNLPGQGEPGHRGLPPLGQQSFIEIVPWSSSGCFTEII